MTMTMPTQETVCNFNAKASHDEPVYKISCLALAVLGIFLGVSKKIKWVT